MKGLFRSKSKGVPEEDDDGGRSNLFGNRKAEPPSSAAPYNANNNNNSNGYTGSSSTAGNPYAGQYGRAPQGGGYGSQGGYAPPRGGNGGGYGGGGYATPDPYTTQHGGGAGGYGAQKSSTYGQSSQDDEDREVQEYNEEASRTRNESVQSTNRALEIAVRAEESARRTLESLGVQGEHLHNTEKNLDVAAVQGQIAKKRTKDLKEANGSMFAMRNPLRSSARERAQEEEMLRLHQTAREERDRTRASGYEGRTNVGGALGGSAGGGGHIPNRSKLTAAEKSKYLYGDDEVEEDKEEAIAANLGQLGAITGRLRGLAVATGTEVDRQNQQIERIANKSDRIDNQLASNTNSLSRIR